MAVASMPRNSIAGRKTNESDMALIVRVAVGLVDARRSAPAWRPPGRRPGSTRIPGDVFGQVADHGGDAGARLAEGAARAAENRYVASTISGSTMKVSSARRGTHREHDHDDADQHQHVADQGDQPCESSSLITATSLITRETVTPTMWVSW